MGYVHVLTSAIPKNIGYGGRGYAYYIYLFLHYERSINDEGMHS